MRKLPTLTLLAAFIAAATIAIFAATFAVSQIETRSTAGVVEALGAEGVEWATVSADGLRIEIGGTAPDEAARFRALSVAGQVVDAARIGDRMDVAQRDPVDAPPFSIEVLRQSDEVTLIGLIPADTDRQALMEQVGRGAKETPIVDLLETAGFDAPEGWDAALAYGMQALGQISTGKVSIAKDRVAIVTIADDEAARTKLDRALRRDLPEALDVAIDITAPRPVIAPFILRLVKSGDTASFDACTAGTEDSARQILTAARAIGVPEDETCRLGLGRPSIAWAATSARAISALGDLAAARLTLSDLSIRLEAQEGQDPDVFEDVVAALRGDLPEEFTLTAVQSDDEALDPEVAPASFGITRSPEGLVQMRGRVGSERAREVVTAFARAIFGLEQVVTAIEVAPQVPTGWGPRLMASLDSMSILTNGAVSVTPDLVTVSGSSGMREATDEIARILSGQLGEEASFEIDVTYDKRADPTLGLPTPQQCVDRINAILTERQITFDPGSAIIDAESRASVDAIAEIVRKCEGVAMEVGGFTDSQGREVMNQQLSQERAEALLAGLTARRVLTGDLVAKGYGEENPIADNGTEAGREANRRLEFRLLAGQEDDGAVDDDAPDGEEAAEAE